MDRVSSVRLRLGALLWLLTLQFFVVEAVVAAGYEGYSRIDDTISLLGSSVSPGATAMNVSFVVQGVLVLGGLVLLRPLLLGRGAQVATAMLAVAAGGLVIVGLLPVGEADGWHRFGAALFLLGCGGGLIGLAYAVRPRSEAVGTTLALLGLLSSAMTVFYLTAATGMLGEGGTERAAAYPLPIGLAVTAVALLRLGRRPLLSAAGEDGEALGPRLARKQQERAERARRARERDEALEAAATRAAADRRAAEAARAAPRPAPAVPDGGDAGHDGDDGDDDFDPDDPWASPRRRG
ncbi:DUF998 domain-containing protein [Trujillonella humicola]|uniref:DUF998 domain-containing protein n=1 Tax=Trujillonella humicola TaxID=3383699 RepID=UPI00390590FC